MTPESRAILEGHLEDLEYRSERGRAEVERVMGDLREMMDARANLINRIDALKKDLAQS